MDKRKVILLFSDLEGTILREEDGKYDDSAMYEFLKQIDTLQQLTKGEVHLHLVSPVYKHQMEEIMGRIDKNIASYNHISDSKNPILPIECGAAYLEDGMISEEFLGDRIFALKKPVDKGNFDMARYGKAKYVRTWCETYKDSFGKELFMAIYCGNGRNDLDAMGYVKDQEHGLVVCPKNSRTEVKEKASYVSEKTDLPGITDGMAEINKQIKKKVEAILGEPKRAEEER